MEQFDRRYRQLRRATVARNALDWVALIFLGCAFAFWGVAFWQLLAPPAILSLLSIQAVVLALVYSLATPLLWSALVPTTPAGQLLQKTQWRTIGFYLIVGAALYLSYQAEMMIELWLSAQPAVRDAGMAQSLAFSLSIAFILIPALAWTQLNPERWLQQIQQAHAVRKLELQQAGELAIIRARLIWVEQKALVGYANLLPAEQREIGQVIRGLCMGITDQQRAIVRTLKIGADVERTFMDDSAIADQMDYVAEMIDAKAIESAHVDSRPEPAIPASVPDDGQRRATTGNDRYLTAARDHFGRTPWTIRALANALDVGETAAKEMRDAWLVAGTAKEARLGRWALTESEPT